MAEVTELATIFTFKGSLKPLEKYTTAIGNSVKATAAIAAGASIAIGGFGALINSTLAASDGLVQLAFETNSTIEEIQQLGFVASQNGSSIEAVQSSIRGLSNKIGEAAIKGSEDLNRLGISARNANGSVKGTTQVLNEIRGSIGRLSSAEQRNILGNLGIDQSLIQTLRTSNKEFNKLNQISSALGVISTKSGKALADYNDSITTLRFGIKSITDRIAIGFAPRLNALSDSFVDLLIKNKELVSDGIERFIDIVSSAAEFAKNLALGLNELIDGTIGWKVAITALVGVFAFLNPITAIISGIALVVDDLFVGFKGGQSVIGDFFKAFNVDIFNVLSRHFKAFSKILSIFADGFKLAFRGFEIIFDDFVSGFKGQESVIGSFFELFNIDIFSTLTSGFKYITDAYNTFIDFLIDNENPVQAFFKLFDVDIFATIREGLESFLSLFKGFGSTKTEIEGTFKPAKQGGVTPYLPAPETLSTPAIRSAATANNATSLVNNANTTSQIINNNTYNIRGDNPQQIANMIDQKQKTNNIANEYQNLGDIF